MQKSLSLRIAAIAMLLTFVVVGIAWASHSWGNYHWGRTANPFTVKLGDNVSSAWDSYLGTTASDWSVSSVLDATIVPGGTDSKYCRSTSGRVELCNKKYGFNGWLGVATIWVSGNHITKGTVKLNDTYFNTSTYNNPNEKLHVMCQEIGHTFGLDHQSTDGGTLNTCMDYFSNTGANANSTLSTKPNQHDYDQLGAIYTHLDLINTISQSVNSSKSNAGHEDRAEWGEARQKDSHGRTSLYEKDLGKGEKLFTFVIWAD